MKTMEEKAKRQIKSSFRADEWLSLKQYVAYGVNKYSSNYGMNLLIYCDVISLESLVSTIRTKIFPKLSESKDVEGLLQLKEALSQDEILQDGVLVDSRIIFGVVPGKFLLRRWKKREEIPHYFCA